MAEDQERKRTVFNKGEEADDLQSRFPAMPPAPELPDAPILAPKLPPNPAKPQPGTVEPGQYNKMALAFTAASSFIMPVLVLSLGGFWLDNRLHTTPWLAFGGVVLGLIVGVVSLLHVVQRLSD